MSEALVQVGVDDQLSRALEDCGALQLQLERMRLRDSLYAFVQEAWSLVEPAQPFTPNWHIEVLCEVLQDITCGRAKASRWVINVPPGTLKSLLISVLWPAWVWARDPKKRFLTASYGLHLSVRDNLRVRDVVLSKWFQQLFPLHLVEDQNTKTRYNTDAGGWRIATSVGGVGTGEHPHFIVVDDPLTAQQAESITELEAANGWLDRTISTRGITMAPVLILVMQRLHEKDPSGHLLEQGDVEHVCFPMRYVATRPATDEHPGYQADPRDRRTQVGELLIPQLITDEKVRKLEIVLGPYGAAGQLQQQPAPEGGGQFKRGWFKFLDAMPTDLRRSVRGWDTAGTEGGGDYTVGVRIDEFGDGQFLVSDVQRDQLGAAGVDDLILTTAKLDGPDVAQREEKEGGSAGKAVIAARAKLLVGYDYQGVLITGSKITRAKPFRAQVEAGNVFLLRAAWNKAYLDELCNFPVADHDDQVDGSSCSFNALLLEPRKKKQYAVW